MCEATVVNSNSITDNLLRVTTYVSLATTYMLQV